MERKTKKEETQLWNIITTLLLVLVGENASKGIGSLGTFGLSWRNTANNLTVLHMTYMSRESSTLEVSATMTELVDVFSHLLELESLNVVMFLD